MEKDTDPESHDSASNVHLTGRVAPSIGNQEPRTGDNEPTQEPHKPPLRTRIWMTFGNWATHDWDRSNWKRLEPKEKWNLFFTLMAILIASWTVRVLTRQLTTMSDQRDVMNQQLGEMIRQYLPLVKSAEAAKQAADTARNALINSQKSFEIDERPYMVGDGPPEFSGAGLAADKSIQANMKFKNIGRTAARKYIVNVGLRRFDPETGEKGRAKLIQFLASSFDALEAQDANGRKEIEQFGIESDLAPNAGNFTTNVTSGAQSVVIPASELPKVGTGEIMLFYVGVVSYRDAFETSYKTEFCYIYFGTDIKTWHNCDSHNTIN